MLLAFLTRTLHPRWLHFSVNPISLFFFWRVCFPCIFIRNIGVPVRNECHVEQVEDIISKLTEQNIGFLYGRDAPPVIGPRATNLDDFIRHLDAPFTPPGEKVHAFVDSCDRHLEVYQVVTFVWHVWKLPHYLLWLFFSEYARRRDQLQILLFSTSRCQHKLSLSCSLMGRILLIWMTIVGFCL